MNGWCLVVLLAVALLGWALLTAKPTVVYLCYGDQWRRPRRIGHNEAEDFTRQHWTRCTNKGCWSRLCKYKHGRDTGSRSHRWTDEVEWDRKPKLWLGPLTVRRRHRVLYVTLPWEGMAIAVENFLIARKRPPFNVQGLDRKHRHHSIRKDAA